MRTPVLLLMLLRAIPRALAAGADLQASGAPLAHAARCHQCNNAGTGARLLLRKDYVTDEV